MNRTRFLITCLLLVAVFGTPLASGQADNITLTFRQAKLDDAIRFAPGQGVLEAPVTGDVTLSTHGVDVIAFDSAFIPTGESEQGVITFRNPTGKRTFSLRFLTPCPSGHGLYRATIPLPSVNTQKTVSFRIENAEKVFVPGIDLTTEDQGRWTRVEATTRSDSLRLIYITELSYTLFADMAAAAIVMVLLAIYILSKHDVLKRRLNIRKLLRDLSNTDSPIGAINTEETTDFYFDYAKLTKLIENKKQRATLKVPNTIISTLIVLVLGYFFVTAFLQPIGKVWPLLEGFQTLAMAAGGLFGLLSLLFLVVAESDIQFLKHIALLSGAIVWMRLAYLEAFGLVFGVATTLLIYYLATIVWEEEEGNTRSKERSKARLTTK